jgi:hypothetical protein
MMTIKHLIAGAVVTAAVSTALVLTSAVGANAQVFPTPTPIGPGSVAKPIYTQPSLPGFHLPAELWTKYGPLPMPKKPQPYSVLPANCSHAVSPYLLGVFASEGYVFTGDTSVHATHDPQLLALLAGHTQISCRWVQPHTGVILDVTDAIGIDDAAVAARLRATGFSEPGPIHGFQQHVDGVWYEQDVFPGQGGWTLVSATDNTDLFGLIMQDAPEALWELNQ